jgi:hypothetical protein
MRKMRLLTGLGALGMLFVAASAAGAQEKADVPVVKYAGLADAVIKNRGKVVLVDIWHLG